MSNIASFETIKEQALSYMTVESFHALKADLTASADPVAEFQRRTGNVVNAVQAKTVVDRIITANDEDFTKARDALATTAVSDDLPPGGTGRLVLTAGETAGLAAGKWSWKGFGFILGGALIALIPGFGEAVGGALVGVGIGMMSRDH